MYSHLPPTIHPPGIPQKYRDIHLCLGIPHTNPPSSIWLLVCFRTSPASLPGVPLSSKDKQTDETAQHNRKIDTHHLSLLSSQKPKHIKRIARRRKLRARQIEPFTADDDDYHPSRLYHCYMVNVVNEETMSFGVKDTQWSIALVTLRPLHYGNDDPNPKTSPTYMYSYTAKLGHRYMDQIQRKNGDQMIRTRNV